MANNMRTASENYATEEEAIKARDEHVANLDLIKECVEHGNSSKYCSHSVYATFTTQQVGRCLILELNMNINYQTVHSRSKSCCTF